MSTNATLKQVMGELAALEEPSYPASPGYTPPYAPVWIAEVVRRKEKAPAPKKRARARKSAVTKARAR